MAPVLVLVSELETRIFCWTTTGSREEEQIGEQSVAGLRAVVARQQLVVSILVCCPQRRGTRPEEGQGGTTGRAGAMRGW